MKKTIILLIAAVMLLTALTSCKGVDPADTGSTATSSGGGDKQPVRDATGKYAVDGKGEAIIAEAAYETDYEVTDNARVFYEIFVGSFSDSDGDGIGDLRGVINRMDYLNDGDPNSGLSLGVEGIWLTPVFKSISYHKYNVDDYYQIDPKFGTMDDLKELVALCHERGVKLILDLPINHTGSLNPWFGSFTVAHRQGKTDDPYYDFYCWYPEGETAPAGRTYAQLSGTTDYYECNFSGDMPELNFDNDAVRQAVLDVAKYYLDLGVDGFRFDAAKYVYFGDNVKSVEFWEWYIPELRKIDPDLYAVAEVWDGDSVTGKYYPALNCFDFTTSQAEGLIAATAKKGDVNKLTAYVDKYLDNIAGTNPDAMILQFIANHDTDRAAGYLTVASGTMHMAANLYLLSPGSPFIYYGEELGMRGSRGGASTDANRRLAMLWGDGDTVADPTGASYPASSQTDQTAAKQIGDASSLYSRYKQLIMIRKANPEIARGDYTALDFTGTKAGGFVSTLDGRSVCVIHNTSGQPVTLDLSAVTDLAFTEVRAAIGGDLTDEDPRVYAELDGTTLTLSPMTSAVLG